MTRTPTTVASSAPLQAKNWLNRSAITWFVVTAIGQWLFVLYIIAYYGLRFGSLGIEGFKGTHLANGFIEGDALGNTALAIHILVASMIIAAGQIQLIPIIRQQYPRLHRYSGWFYMLSSVAVSIAGIYLIWSRERVIGSFVQDIGVTTGGLLVLAFMPLALYYAIKRDFIRHKRWVLRLFMAVSAVWFLRLIVFSWMIATGGVGMDFQTFSGPFLSIANFAQYLVPLAVLELYLRAQKSHSSSFKHTVASIVFLMTAIMAVGIVGISLFFWFPYIAG